MTDRSCCIVISTGEPCGKPGIYSELCGCDACDRQPGYHLNVWLCAEHYDKVMAQRESSRLRAADPAFGEEDL
jgi:hypothetical protein